MARPEWAAYRPTCAKVVVNSSHSAALWWRLQHSGCRGNACPARSVPRMTAATITTDPASREGPSWAGRLAWLISQGTPEGDPQVVECRQALAYHRLRKSIAAEVGQLSQVGADRLAADLREAVAR